MKVAIFGAGTMGSGIAQVFAANGHTALMYASSVPSAQQHKDKLAASLAKRVAKGKMPMCVQHCQAWCLYHGEVGDLAKKIDGTSRCALLVPSV